MKKLVTPLIIAALLGVASAQSGSQATSQTEAFKDLTVQGRIGDQTSFSLPSATLNLTPNALVSEQNFIVRVPVTNTTTYPIVVDYGSLPSFGGFANIVGPARNITINPGASYTFDFNVTIGTLPANLPRETVSAQIRFTAKGQPGEAGIQGF